MVNVLWVLRVKYNNGKIVKYKGATYGSYSALARAEGIKPELLTARIRKGLTVAQAVKELKYAQGAR